MSGYRLYRYGCDMTNYHACLQLRMAGNCLLASLRHIAVKDRTCKSPSVAGISMQRTDSIVVSLYNDNSRGSDTMLWIVKTLLFSS